MFKLRDEIPTDDEIRRQNIVVRIVFGNTDPITLLEKKAAAIVGHPSIDPILSAKTLRALPNVLELVSRDEDLLEIKLKNKILQLVLAERLTHDDTVILPTKRRVFVPPGGATMDSAAPEPPLINLPIRQLSYVSLADFERFAFDSKILYKYYRNTSFASYLFQNLVYSQDLVNEPQLGSLYGDDGRTWQTRLAALLYVTNVNERVAIDAFYSDFVAYNKREFDVSFVPNYDVSSIRPLDEIVPSASDQETINYYYDFDPSVTARVPDRYLGIFLSFPFKSGYYVHPNGTVAFANLKRVSRKSVTSSLARICDISDVEAAIENVSRQVTLDDALSYAAYAKTLTSQGIALMVVRRITGNSAIYMPTVSAYLHLDSEFNMLSWMNVSCVRGQIVMPVLYRSPTGDESIALIRDIARSCATKIGAAVISSAYCVPEIDLHYAYSHLKTDAERYVLYTLIVQQYPNIMYHASRNTLRPSFGFDPVDMSVHETSRRKHAPRRVYENYQKMLFGEQSDAPSNCLSDRCLDNYEFTNPQLNALTKQDDIEMTEHQLARYIASTLK